MTVSKRVRFEVLRRDNHTCRYCHATDSPLTVDHVTPVALGGTDTPDNLVAACRDCNAGKSSASPDSSLVAEVHEDALRHAEMIKQAYAVLVQWMGERDEYVDEFAEAFPKTPVPADWRNSVGRWFEMGVPIELVVDAAQRALAKTGCFSGADRFKYMCGIVWNQVHAVTEAVGLKQAIEGSFMTGDALTNERIEAYETGYTKGQGHGLNQGLNEYWSNEAQARLLTNVIDHSYRDLRSFYEEVATGWLSDIRDAVPGENLQPLGGAW